MVFMPPSYNITDKGPTLINGILLLRFLCKSDKTTIFSANTQGGNDMIMETARCHSKRIGQLAGSRPSPEAQI